METLIAFKGDAKLKADILKEINKHETADSILQGTYGKQNGTWKGCAVACSLRSLAIVKKEELVTEYNQHERYETDLGISQTIARLEDKLFEGMTPENAKTFPRKFIEAVPVGADLSLVPAKFMVFILNDTLQHEEVRANAEVVKAVQGVIKLWEDVINGKYIGKDKQLESARSAAWSAAASAARSARSAAWSAAASAARSAESAAWSAAASAARSAESAARSAESAAASAAESAARSAESAAWSAESAAASAARSAESAAWSAAASAARSAAASAAESAAYKRYADHLLLLIEESPVTKKK